MTAPLDGVLQPRVPDPARSPAYRVAFADWLACAAGGGDSPTARAAASIGSSLDDRLIALGAAGHVLDFDDTYAPGLMHVSAPIGPCVLAIGAEVDATVHQGLEAFARGWEASAALSRANHPGLGARGWHPTAVCGAVGAAIATAALLELGPDEEQQAIRLALLRASGLRAAFGSPGKSLQVGFAAAAGAGAARLAQAGASADRSVVDGPAGFAEVYGVRVVLRDDADAIDENWIKAYPCCLQTHSAIEAAIAAREDGKDIRGATVHVHPVSRRVAALDDVRDGLEAKFSIPYLAAHAFLSGAPVVESFREVDQEARSLAQSLRVLTDDRLLESQAVLETKAGSLYEVVAASGSPLRPMSPGQLEDKIASLGGSELADALEDPARPLADVLTELRVGAASG